MAMNTIAEPQRPSSLAPWLQRQLKSLASRTGPWLLQGPEGMGQFDLALALAREWLCESPTAEGACGHCASCHAIMVRTHPDLLALMPETEMLALEWPGAPESGGSGKKTKPSNDIRIQALRAAIEFAQRTSSRGRGKVIIVHPAERMNTVSANALLKTLEEPAPGVRFILSSGAGQSLLPTIRSRCLTHTMSWPTQEEALTWLLARGASREQAELALRAAGGRPDVAWRFCADTEALHGWAGTAAAVRSGDIAGFANLSLPALVERLQKLCHDLLAMGVGAQPRFFASADLATCHPDPTRLLQWWRDLGDMARAADHPLQAQLTRDYVLAISQRALR